MNFLRKRKVYLVCGAGPVAVLLAVASLYKVWADAGLNPNITVNTEFPPVGEGGTYSQTLYTSNGNVPSFLPFVVLSNVTAASDVYSAASVQMVLGGDFIPQQSQITGELESVPATRWTRGGPGEYYAVMNAALMDFQETARGTLGGLFASDIVRTVATATAYAPPARTVTDVDEFSAINLSLEVRNRGEIDGDENLIPDASALLNAPLPFIELGRSGLVTVVTSLNSPVRGGTFCGADTVFFQTASGPIAVDVTTPCLADMQAVDTSLLVYDTARLVVTMSPTTPEATLDGPSGVNPLGEFDLAPLPAPQNLFVRTNILLATADRGVIPTWTTLPGGQLPGSQQIVIDVSGPGMDAALTPGNEVAAYTYNVSLTQAGEDIEANGDEDGWVEVGSDTFPFATRVTTLQAGDNVVEISSNNTSAIYATNAAPRIDTGEGGHHHHGGACFIATAAYGTPLDGQIDKLRSVRDQFMIGNPIGAAFVDSYYRISPPIAWAVSENPMVRGFVRIALSPVLALSGWLLASPGSFGAAAALAAIAMMAMVTRRVRRSKQA